VVLFRYFEAQGQVHRAISVVKKRSGEHEMTIRQLQIQNSGLQVGEPLTGFQGILTGVPAFVGKHSDLFEKGRDVGTKS
jgi:circadian clock protein KaiC